MHIESNIATRGVRLRELRHRAHMSQEAVAREVGVTMRAYQAWERDESRIRWPNLVRLAAVLQTTTDYIERGHHKDKLALILEALDRIERRLASHDPPCGDR